MSVGVSPGVGKRGGISAVRETEGGEVSASGGAFFLSIETGGVIKTDDNLSDDFFAGVEQLAIAFRQTAAFRGAMVASSPIHSREDASTSCSC